MHFCCFFCCILLQYTCMDFELKIIKFLQANASPNWINFFQAITLFGSLLGFAIVFCILFVKKRKLSYVFAVAFAIASVANFALKMLIARQRPFDVDSDIINYGQESGFSMPSGHSMSAAFFATFVCFLCYKMTKRISTKALCTICCVLFTCLIAFSRMVLGVHYLTDTIAGIFVGVLFAITAILVYNRYIIKPSRKKE